MFGWETIGKSGWKGWVAPTILRAPGWETIGPTILLLPGGVGPTIQSEGLKGAGGNRSWLDCSAIPLLLYA